MASAAVPSSPAGSVPDDEVSRQLAQATRRIRYQDLFFGALLVVLVTLSYLAVIITLDRLVELPDWARQVGFVGLLGILGAIGYRWIIRPMQRRLNPLYAAKQIEATVEDAKNSIVNWVDLRDRNLPESIQKMLGVRAARQLKEADLDHAGETRKLIWAGASVAALVTVLAVLFLVFRTAVFGSLVARAMNPFRSIELATRTQLQITEPASGDITVTAGKPVTIGVHVDGRVPDPESPSRLRVLLRHNPMDTNFEEVPMEVGDTGRDWKVRIPDYLVQNGFWYRVAGGDGETAEHRVTVRPKPMFTGFQVKYEYPAYLRMPVETTTDPHIDAYQGTKITLTARANRELRDGRAVVVDQTVRGEVIGEEKDTLRVQFELKQSGTYRLIFNSTSGETNSDSLPFDVRVRIDQPPSVVISQPREDEITLPANGLLAVDASVGDDFGIDTVALRLRMVGNIGLPLKGKPYQQGKSFRREADGTFPTSLEYKDSLKLTEVTDDVGRIVPLKEGMTLEYWVEATDNQRIPDDALSGQLGKSKILRVKLGPPVTEMKKQEEQQKAVENRQQQEQKHQKAEQQKLDAEQRPAKASPQQGKAETAPDAAKPEGQPEPQTKPETAPMPQQGKPEPREGEQPAGPQPKPMDPKEPAPADSKKPDPASEPMPGEGTPKEGTPQEGPPKEGTPQPGASKTEEQRKIEEQAREVQKAIDEQQKRGGEGKGAETPMPGEQPDPANAKGSPDPKSASGESKDPVQSGAQAKPEPMSSEPTTSTSKPEPKQDEAQMKDPPLGGVAGNEKPGESQSKDAGQPKPDAAPGTKEKTPGPAESKGDGQTPAAEARPAPMDKPGESMPTQEKPGEARGDQPTSPAQTKKPAPDAPRTEKSEPKGKPESNSQPSQGGSPMGDPTGKPGQPQPGPGQPAPQDPAQAKETPPSANPRTDNELQREQGGKNGKTEQVKQGPQQADYLSRDELKKATNDLASGNEQQKQEARDTLDKGLGQQNRKELEKEADELSKKMKSQNPQEQQQAEEKLDQLQKKSQQHAQQQKNAEQMRQEAEQLAKDLQSGDPQKQQAAQKKLDDLKQKAEQLAGKQDPEQMRKDLEQAAKDLQSGDPQKQQAALDKLDQMMGKEARQEAEQLAKDLQSQDLATRQAAQKKLDDLKQKAEQLAGKQDQQQPKPTPEQMEQLAKAAEDLNSPDEAKRKAAEEKLDQQIGKDMREQLQKDMQELAQNPDGPRAKELKQKMDEMAKNLQNPGKKFERSGGRPADLVDADGKPMEDNPENRLKAAQLQLEKFKKNEANKELQKRLGYTEEEYKRFLEGYEQRVKELEKEAQLARELPAPKKTSEPVATRRVDTSGKVTQRADGTKADPQGAGVTVAPPGYSEAQRRFMEQASKIRSAEEKK